MSLPLQYLFENSRVENIFMDRFYSKFSAEFTNMLRGFQPAITPSGELFFFFRVLIQQTCWLEPLSYIFAGYVHSRVEEEFLWDCKQLGAYSPIVLLNTLLYFCCKYFGFTTVEQHRQLSFAHVMRCTKTNQDNTKTTFLRFYPPIAMNEADTGTRAQVWRTLNCVGFFMFKMMEDLSVHPSSSIRGSCLYEKHQNQNSIN